MERVTITIEAELLATVDRMVEQKGYGSRSEAVRDLVREVTDRQAVMAPDEPCIATLSYVYDHEVRDLARRITRTHHDHHEISLASLHVHLSHVTCLEVAVLRGPSGAIRRFADSVTSQRGVRHHQLHIVPDHGEQEQHDHGNGNGNGNGRHSHPRS